MAVIEHQDAIRVARSLLDTPYEQLDCINLIKKVIRTAPGGVAKYTTAGTNSLWKSFSMSKKYRDLTWRQEGISAAAGTAAGSPSGDNQNERCDARAGMLAFKRSGSDVHHVGLVTDCGTVIHSSSEHGCVVETALSQEEGWALIALHRYIAAAQTPTVLPSIQADLSKGKGVCAVTIIDSQENVFVPVGDFRVLLGSVD